MSGLIRTLSVSVVAILLAACGGGGGDSSTGGGGNGNGSTPTPSQIISGAKNYSAAQLNTAATSLANSKYSGSKSSAAVNINSAQQAYQMLFGDSAIEVPEVAEQDFSSAMDNQGNINETFSCDLGGSVKYDGKVSASEFTGTIALTYNNCVLYANEFAISGNAAIAITSFSDTNIQYSLYFNNLRWQQDNQTTSLSGVISFSEQYNNGGFSVLSTQYVSFDVGGEEYMIDAEFLMSDDNGQFTGEVNAEFYTGSQGKFSVQMNSADSMPPYMYNGEVLIDGDIAAAFLFENGLITYAEDNNSDGTFDVGTYIVDFDELAVGDLTSKVLVALDLLSLPPEVGAPYFPSYSEVSTLDEITVEKGYFYDPDNNDSELVFTYRWYINDELVSGVNGRTLPANVAVFGDTLEVSMVVSDGANVIESSRITITLIDTPATAEVSGVPEFTRSGETIQFVVNINDPDSVNDQAAVMLSGPEGATIDNGSVTWTVPDTLLNEQYFYFSFGPEGSGNDQASALSVPVRVVTDKPMPDARSGISLTSLNNNIQIVDIEQDGSNELLAVDSANHVYIARWTGSDYEQYWVYPYAFPSEGTVKQAIAVNTDEDAQLEILVFTQHGISLIDDVTQPATLVKGLQAHRYIVKAAAADSDGDGIVEIAFLIADDDYYWDSAHELEVISLDNPDTALLTTSLSDSFELVFANVDNDSQSELIVNSGYVYDGDTWANQWFRGTGFGERMVTAGDFDNDGVVEIVGGSEWGNITVFSAVSKSQIAVLDNDNLNICSIAALDLNDDQQSELLTGDCQWGEIKAYDLSSQQFNELWSVDMQEYNSYSLALGDIDNNGDVEVLWTSGGRLFTADASISSASAWSNASPIAWNYTAAAGWARWANTTAKPTYLVANTDSFSDSLQVGYFNEDGSFEVSEGLGGYWGYSDNSAQIFVSDINGDDSDELFVPFSSENFGDFGVLQLLDMSLYWELSSSMSSTIAIHDAQDMNGDGVDDALLSDDNVLKAIDVANQSIIASTSLDVYFAEAKVLDVDGSPVIVVASSNELGLYTLTTSGFVKQTSVERNCLQIMAIHYDTDNQLELACAVRDYSYNDTASTIAYFDVTTSALTEITEVALAGDIVDMLVDPTTSAPQSLLVVEHLIDDYAYSWEPQFKLMKLSQAGQPVWSSPKFDGYYNRNTLRARMNAQGKLEVLLATNNMVLSLK